MKQKQILFEINAQSEELSIKGKERWFRIIHINTGESATVNACWHDRVIQEEVKRFCGSISSPKAMQFAVVPRDLV